MHYKIGDKIRMTTLTWGELITDRKGNPIHQTPAKSVYEGTVTFAGPEAAFKGAVEVVRCNGGNKALKLNSGFGFYPKDNGTEQIVEVLSDVDAKDDSPVLPGPYFGSGRYLGAGGLWDAYTTTQIQTYGQQCAAHARKLALEEAEKRMLAKAAELGIYNHHATKALVEALKGK